MNEQEETIEQNTATKNPLAFHATPFQKGVSPKIAILHDAFLYRGGGERLVTLMAKYLHADLISGFFSMGSFDPRELGFTGRMISLGKPVFMRGLRHMILKWRFARHADILSGYDTVIFSGNCLDALHHVRSDAQKIYYCHTPPRYLFDFRDAYLSRIPSLIRPLFQWVFDRHAEKYRTHLAHFDLIFTNSENVHDRLLAFCGYESEILYPPTDTSRFAPMNNEQGTMNNEQGTMNSEQGTVNIPIQIIKPSTYFLSFSRLSLPKRVGLIVDAFLEMPEQNLILTYGKNDPLKREILQQIEGKPNILALESPSDDELISLIQGAIASISLPIDEDFGMSPVESMACGTPVIGANEGGLRETIFDGRTGKLIDIMDHLSGIKVLKETVQGIDRDAWKHMRHDCRLRADDFSLEKFEKKLQFHLDKR